MLEAEPLVKSLQTFLHRTFFLFVLNVGLLVGLSQPIFAQDVFGRVQPPLGVDRYNAQSPDNLGIVLFISNLIKLATLIAGIWVLINFILAGYTYLNSAGDSGAHSKVRDQMTMSVIGLVIIVTSYTLTALISYVVFGDPGYVLNPQLQGPAL